MGVMISWTTDDEAWKHDQEVGSHSKGRRIEKERLARSYRLQRLGRAVGSGMDGRQRSDVARRPHRHGGRAGGRGEPGTRCGLHGRDGLRLSSRSRSAKGGTHTPSIPRPSPAANATAPPSGRPGKRSVDMAAPRVGVSCCEQTPSRCHELMIDHHGIT